MKTKIHTTMSALTATALLLVLVVVCGCDGDDPGTPGGGPEPVVINVPELIARRLVNFDRLDVLEMAPVWSEDDQWILFNAGPGSVVWKIEVDGKAEPVAVTNPEHVHWILGGYAPFALDKGRVGYFQGVLPGSFGMHLMAIGLDAVAGEPEAEVLRTFLGPSVGLTDNQISSPRMLSMDAQAVRGVGTWHTTWFLRWFEQENGPILITRPATGLEDAVDFRISHDGEWVAYRNGAGMVSWIPFNAEEAHPLGAGHHPSFSGDGSKVGYVAPNAHDYVVYPREGGPPVLYKGVDLVDIEYPVLSMAGDRIAFLSESDEGISLFVGRLEP
jgi:hypothetical protein